MNVACINRSILSKRCSVHRYLSLRNLVVSWAPQWDRIYFLMLCWNVCLVNIDRHGGVSDVDRFRDANVLSYDSICHDVCDLCHGALFHFFCLGGLWHELPWLLFGCIFGSLIHRLDSWFFYSINKMYGLFLWCWSTS